MTKAKSSKTVSDTAKKVAELKTQIFNEKFKKHTTGAEKPHVLKNLKKDVARLLTAENSKK